MSAEVTIVSVHSGASTPATEDSPTPDRYAPGFQPYAVLTSTRPAQVWPSLVCRLYFMSRYAWLAGDMTTLVPFATADASGALLVVVSQNCATVDASSGALAMSCQPMTALPCAATICCARLMKH